MAGPNEAILDALTDALVTALTPDVPVYRSGQQARDGGSASGFPYVQIGAMILLPWDTAYELGHSLTVRIHAKWRGSDPAPGMAVQDAIYAALHNGNLLTEGGSTILMQRQSTTVFELPDSSWDGVCEYRALIETI